MKFKNNNDGHGISSLGIKKWRHIVNAGLLGAMLLLSACAGKEKVQDTANSEPVIDMTRPPTTIKGVSAAEEESNPDETVSFEKWKKERQGDDQ